MRRSVDVRVTGRVQGVSFRYHAEREAAAASLWGRTSDGVVAVGTRAAAR